jgi:hypothetical protein
LAADAARSALVALFLQRMVRAERVEVLALAFDADLGSDIEDQRVREVTRRACAWWRVPLLGREQLIASIGEFGSPVPVETPACGS